MSYNTETPQVSAQLLNSNFMRKLEEGRTKEAQAEGTAFIRSRLRQESFAREILPPVTLSDDEIDRDEFTDLPKKIVEIEPDSTATFVPFKGTGPQTWFKGPRYSVFFGKTESQRFTKSKFELMTYQNDIRKILSDNSVKDMADEEDRRFLATINTIVAANAAQETDNQVNNAAFTGFDPAGFRQGMQALVGRRLPLGKMLMNKSTYLMALELAQGEVGDDILSRHYDEGVENEEKLWGIPVITTIKDDICLDGEVYLFAPQNYLGNFFLLQDATLFIKQEADIVEFWSYAAPGIGIGNTLAVQKILV
jgi:hypothetical protein